MSVPEARKPPTRVAISPGSILLVLLALAVAALAADVLVAARRVLSWVVACAVAAALIEFIVRALQRFMARWLAVILVLLGVAGVAALLVFGAFQDLDREVSRLQEVAPEAAERIERSQRVGDVATEVELARRVTDAVERLKQPSSGLANEAVSSGGAYIVSAVLTVLFLSWGPKLARAGFHQLDRERAEVVRRIAVTAFRRSRRYVLMAVAQATVVGVLGWLVCRWADLPAPVPLGLALAAMTMIPGLGILLGSLPILLLAGGLNPREEVLAIAAFFLLLQGVSSFVVQRWIVRHSLYVGPAIVVIAYLVGFELYGIGGAIYSAAIAVGIVAVVDAAEVEETSGGEGPSAATEAAPLET